MTGKDAKGRTQPLYSDAHWAASAKAKFALAKELIDKHDEIRKEVRAGLKKEGVKEEAACMRLVMHTGIRPGSNADTGGDKKAYGATTLKGSHVVEKKDGVHLKFVGKKGMNLDIKVDDPEIAADLVSRARKAGSSGRLFETSNRKLLDYSHSLDGGDFKPKDMRTAVGTTTAAKMVKSMPKPTSAAEYKKAVKEVAVAVSARLGNTPTVALQSYINPAVFSGWRVPK